MGIVALAIKVALATEAGAIMRMMVDRASRYELAQSLAAASGKQLLVVGGPLLVGHTALFGPANHGFGDV